MIKKFPLCFEIRPKESLPNQVITINYENLLNSLEKAGCDLLLSVRCLYNPLNLRKISYFILLNKPLQDEDDGNDKEALLLKIISLLKKGDLSQIYNVKYIEEGFPELGWANVIGEISKSSEILEKPNFIGYVPYLFETKIPEDNFSLADFLNEKFADKIMLEIIIAKHNFVREQSDWASAINDLVNRLDNNLNQGNGDSYLRMVLEVYEKYQTLYSENQLFSFNIKTLGRASDDVFIVLQRLLDVVSLGKHTRLSPITILTMNDARFVASLEATENVFLSQPIQWSGWDTKLGKSLANKFIKETIGTGGLLSSLDDKSLNFPVVPSHLTQSLKEFDSGSINSSALHQLKHSHTALDKSSVIAKIYASKLPKINDLKFLTLVSTYQELIGFFGCFNPLLLDSLEEPRNLLDNSLLAVIQKHKKNITEDTHIIGIKHNGEVCIHNWRKCPHCIIAGTTGSGKTNFLFFLVYQILYSNCDSDIFIADFQAGLHFQLIAKQHQHVKMITQHEEFLETLKNLCNLHDERRTSMISNKVRTIEKLYEKTGIKVNRTFLIIDEAFHIDYAENLIKREIEKCLTILASQARVTHIHIVYCSQSPNLFNRQIKANIEGRIVLRVANNNESLGLLDNFSALNLPEGTAIYRDIPYDPKSPTIVKIPYIPDEIWDFPITKF